MFSSIVLIVIFTVQYLQTWFLVGWVVCSLAEGLVGGLVGWRAGWLADSLVGC